MCVRAERTPRAVTPGCLAQAVRETADALEQAGEELETDLAAAREEIEMLENGPSFTHKTM